MTPHLALVLGTARVGRQSEKVAKFVFAHLQNRSDLTVEFVDVRDHLFGATEGGDVAPWQSIAAKADGFIIVSPEYNHSFPGELKILIDSLDEEYRHKPVGICSVSSGSFGGVRMADHIKPVLIDLGMVVIKKAVQFPNVETLFDEAGLPADADRYHKRITEFADELIWFAQKLG